MTKTSKVQALVVAAANVTIGLGLLVILILVLGVRKVFLAAGGSLKHHALFEPT